MIPFKISYSTYLQQGRKQWVQWMAWMQRTKKIIVVELWVLVCCTNGGVGIQTSKNLLDWSHLVNSNEHMICIRMFLWDWNCCQIVVSTNGMLSLCGTLCKKRFANHMKHAWKPIKVNAIISLVTFQSVWHLYN